LLKHLAFRHVSVRPQHPQQDIQALEAHKKLRRPGSRGPCPRRPGTGRSRCGGRMRPASVSKAP
jgi:hypothetical protein